MTEQFKVGDRIQFKTWDEVTKICGCTGDCDCCTEEWCSSSELKDLCGTDATITEICGSYVSLANLTAKVTPSLLYREEVLEHIEPLKRCNKTIAVDFDGTLCTNKYPDIGEAKADVIQKLAQEQANGARVILWTCREGELLHEAIGWCKAHGIVFDAINENLPDEIDKWGTDPRKVGADEYWDDKAVKV